MKRTIINPKNNWSYWATEMKEALVKGANNTRLGEKLVFENSEFKIWKIHLQSGKSLPFHKHCKRYFWTVLSYGKSRSYYNDGSVIDSEYESGDTKYFDNLSEKNYFIHNLENIGDTTLIFTTVEFLMAIV